MVVIEKQRIIRRGGPCVLPKGTNTVKQGEFTAKLTFFCGRTQGPPLRIPRRFMVTTNLSVKLPFVKFCTIIYTEVTKNKNFRKKKSTFNFCSVYYIRKAKMRHLSSVLGKNIIFLKNFSKIKSSFDFFAVYYI